MSLDKSSCALLAYLLELEHPETIMSISKALEQSRRKIYYHLDKINQSFPSEVPPIEPRPRVGILLTKEQGKACQSLFSEIDSYSYILNMSERIQLMTLYIAMVPRRVTIELLMELTEVSRNTVLNDLNDIRQQLALEQYCMTLHSTKSKGYYFNGHPLNKIQYLHSLLDDMISEGTEGFLTIVKDKLAQELEEEFLLSEDFQAFLKESVTELGEQSGKKLQHHDISFMLESLPYILLSYRNMSLSLDSKRGLEREFGMIRQRMEYDLVVRFNRQLFQRFGFSLDDVELSVIALLLLSYRKDKDAHTASTDFEELRQTLETFIDLFESSSDFVIEQREDLLRNLLMHCKALLFRKTYGIFSKNPLTKQIMQKYPDLFVLTKHCAQFLEESWMISLNDDNIAYLTIHLGGALRRSQEKAKKKRICYIICDEGVSVQRLLWKQCQQYLADISVEGIFTTEQFHSIEDLIEADLLISTNHSLEAKQTLLYVHPILSLEDSMLLTQFRHHHNHQQKESPFTKKLEKLLVHQLGDSLETRELQEAIQQLIRKEFLVAEKMSQTDIY